MTLIILSAGIFDNKPTINWILEYTLENIFSKNRK